MKRSLIFAIPLLLTATCCSPPPKAPEGPKPSPAARMRSSTVALVAELGAGEVAAFCSGVWVSQDEVLTAYHCTEDGEFGKPMLVVTSEDVFAPGSPEERSFIAPRQTVLWATDEAHDLALLKVKAAPSQHVVVRLSVETLDVGSSVHAVGHSLGLWWSYSSGEVAAVRKIDTGYVDQVLIQTTAPISPGNSGGGLFDDHGDLLGICHASAMRGQNLNFFIHRNDIERFLHAASEGQEPEDHRP